MRHFLFFIFSIVLFSSFCLGQTHDIKYVKFIDKIGTTYNTNFNNNTIQKKPERVSSKKGEIIVRHDEFLPDSIKTAIEVAASLWEAKLVTKVPIYVEIIFEPLESDISMISEVGFYENVNGLSVPTSLYAQVNNQVNRDLEYPDSYIILNSLIDWNCYFTDHLNKGFNITTNVMRGIAHCLGYGSSLQEYDNKYFFSSTSPTLFDSHLFKETLNFLNVTHDNYLISKFATSDSIKFVTPNNSYQIYAPKEFDPNMSLKYSHDENSLMSYMLGKGNIYLSIDDETVDILNNIGWNLPYSTAEVKSYDLLKDGIGSSYVSHSFFLSDIKDEISSYHWVFSVKDKSGKYIEKGVSTNQSFTIEPVEDINNLYINTNGDIEGKIDCKYIINNKEFNAVPFYLSLELKPIIKSVDSFRVIDIDDSKFSLQFNVSYVGAEKVTIEVEEEFNPAIRSTMIYEPFIAHVITGNISSYYYSWITIIVKNKYGAAYKTFEFQPKYYNKSNNVKKNFPDKMLDFRTIRIFNINGISVYEGSVNTFNKSKLTPGIYFYETIDSNGNKNISKFLIK